MEGIKEIDTTRVEIDVMRLKEFGRFLRNLDLGSDEYHKNLAFLTFELACVTSYQNRKTGKIGEILAKEILKIVPFLKDDGDYIRLSHILLYHVQENLADALYHKVSHSQGKCTL